MLEVVEHLEALATREILPADNTEGLCVELKDKFGPELIDIIRKHASGFNMFSGDLMYPIPCPKGFNAKRRYNGTMNLWIGTYGDIRLMFCAYLAEVLRGEL